MAIYRVTVQWMGFQGAPGYSNFHFTESVSDPGVRAGWDRVRAFFNAVNGILPGEVEYRLDGEVAIIDETTGMITDYEVAEASPGTGHGGDISGYSAASGAVVTWNTAGVRNGRRVRGRTFLVPLGGMSYQSDGTLTSSAISTISDAAQEMVGEGFDSGFGIFSRPTNGSAGGFYEVNGFRVPDMSAVLRSRRD